MTRVIPDQQHQRARQAVTAARWTLRVVLGSALAVFAGTVGPRPSDTLVAERREGHARLFEQCGRRKACLMKPSAAHGDHRVAAIDAGTDAPVVPLRRWSKAEFDNVTVWLSPGDSVPLWRAADRMMVRDAFHVWSAAGAPVRFVFVPDSAAADVRVTWSDSLPDGRAGQVTRFADHQGWVRSAVLEMSTRNLAGGVQDTLTLRAVALHEVGHLLGLEHSRDERDVMAPWVVARKLTPRDVAAMRTLYERTNPPESLAR